MTLTKKNIAGKYYYTDDKKYYTEYKIKPNDKGLMQIARDQMHDEKRYKEILRLNNSTGEEIKNKDLIAPNRTLLLPTVSPFGK